MDVWSTIHAERKALVGDLESAPEDAWSTPSLCSGWTVRDVVAHMTAAARMSGPRFFSQLASSGFSFEKVQARGIAAERGSSPADTLDHFRAVADSKGRPPGPLDTMLGEVIVHSEDVRRPLGIKHEYPTDAVVRAADFLKKSNLIIGTKRRITGVQLRATDADWQSGSGPQISGPMLSLLMAMTGRKAALDDLAGDGVETLRSRA
jgi:uncharacterized protein (TIGR03083 family)